MLSSRFYLALSWAIAFSLVAAGIAPLNNNLQIRNAPGTSSSETLRAFGRSLSAAVFRRDNTVFKNSTSLDTSWNGAVLYSDQDQAQEGAVSISSGVEIVCTTCYIKGTATAQLTINGGFNISQAFKNVTSEIGTEFSNISTTFVDYIETYTKDVINNLGDGFDTDDFDFPPLQIDIDIDIPDIPECELQFQFDGMELYMEIDTTLSGGATYTLNLYTSNTPIGFGVGTELLVGVVFTIDLILSVESQIDITSGFHIKLDDGIAIDIHLFDQNVSSITFNGGSFEFLPVTIQSSGAVLTALLRVGIKAGIELSIPSGDIGDAALDLSAGIEAGVWADVAQFKTNVTAAPANNDNACKLQVIEEYTLLVGANAGASLAIEDHTWGPTPETQIPIWYTTLAEACAVTRTASVITSPTDTATTIVARDDLTTTTISTKITHTATACLSTGLVNCPVSLQSTSKNTVTQTLVTAVPSGSDATFPATTQNSVASAIAFGANIHAITATSGSPVSFVPPPSSTATLSPSGTANILHGKTGGVSNKIIIGVSVGVGVPVLLAIIAGSIYCCRRKRYASANQPRPTYLQNPEPYTPGSYTSTKKSPNVNVVETRRHY